VRGSMRGEATGPGEGRRKAARLFSLLCLLLCAAGCGGERHTVFRVEREGESDTAKRIVVDGTTSVHIDRLSGIKAVEGNVIIVNNPELNDLDGLRTLVSVGGSLIIENNQRLTALDGLSSLKSVGGDLIIKRNERGNDTLEGDETTEQLREAVRYYLEMEGEGESGETFRFLKRLANTEGVPDEKSGEVLADRFIDLMRATGMPNGLSAVGYTAEDVDKLVEGTLPQHRVTKLSPRPFLNPMAVTSSTSSHGSVWRRENSTRAMTVLLSRSSRTVDLRQWASAVKWWERRFIRLPCLLFDTAWVILSPRDRRCAPAGNHIPP